MQARRVLALAVLALCAPACRTERSESPAGLAQAQPLELAAQRMWRVVEAGSTRGIVVRFAAADAPDDPARQFYSVRNELQQELGFIDGLGRAWRFELHQAAPTFVGCGSVVEGARAILSLGATAELAQVSFGENAPAVSRD